MDNTDEEEEEMVDTVKDGQAIQIGAVSGTVETGKIVSIPGTPVPVQAVTGERLIS
jgi:hypothetical protein